MHCSNEDAEHSTIFYECSRFDEVEDRKNYAPRCKECDYPMKPHSMFFDEAYSEHYYRQKTVDDFWYDADCLIVIGTALATSYAKQIVTRMLEREALVIEVNMESCIPVGNCLQVLGRSEATLQQMFDSYYKSMNKSKESKCKTK